MKGREAARAAGRRAREAEAATEGLKAELAAEKAARKADAEQFKSEIVSLRSGHRAEAERLAAAEVSRRIADYEDQQRQLGFSVDMGKHLLWQKDKLVRNACRYISMTKGIDPSSALELVVTWITDEDCYGLSSSLDFIVKLGLPNDGWVAAELRRVQHWNKAGRQHRRRLNRAAAVSLDHAEDEGHPSIHPKYNPAWYPRVTYGAMHLAEDEAQQAG